VEKVRGYNTHKQWLWMTMDAMSRQVIACDVGDRSRRSGKRLWAKILETHRHHATFYAEQYAGYAG
jgi:IS1 family transposase